MLSLGILACMFLPLSQCSGSWSSPKKHSQTIPTNESAVENPVLSKTEATIVVVNKLPKTIQEFVVLVTFIAPLLFCVPYSKNRKLHLVHLLTQTAFTGWLLFLVFVLVHSIFEPLYGGYILTFLSGAFLVNTLFEWVVFIRTTKLIFNPRGAPNAH